jgi:hypothetical protein
MRQCLAAAGPDARLLPPAARVPDRCRIGRLGDLRLGDSGASGTDVAASGSRLARLDFQAQPQQGGATTLTSPRPRGLLAPPPGFRARPPAFDATSVPSDAGRFGDGCLVDRQAAGNDAFATPIVQPPDAGEVS